MSVRLKMSRLLTLNGNREHWKSGLQNHILSSIPALTADIFPASAPETQLRL